jgi:YidC/Oxa1 family membrane protein insertase
VVVGLGSTRSLSFWGSAPAPAPTVLAPVPPPTPATPEIPDAVSQLEEFAVVTPVPEPTSVSEVVTSLDIPSTLEVLPLNYGDLAALGFSHWTPVGISQWTMELIQVTSGMPWFWTIVTATVLSRFIILPFNINSLRATAKLAPHQPRLMELRNELQNIGGLSNDPIAVQRISLQQKKIYEEAGVSVMGPLLTPLVQVPVSVGLFLGVKKLCDFPLEQLKHGGYGWITDLTIPDPTYVLPLAMAVLINVQLSVSDHF